MPRVAVIIPAWNAAAFIHHAIDSVLGQGHPDFELIVVDDGSPDPAALDAVLARYPDPRIRSIRRDNGGPSAARNTGIEAATAPLVAFLDADDWWEPGYLAHQLAKFDADPSIALTYCDAWLTGDPRLERRTFMQLSPSSGDVTLDHLLSLQCNIPTTCVVARRQSLIDAGWFDPALRRCEDFHLWVRLAARGERMTYSRDVLAHHRMHEASAMADKCAMFEAQRVVFTRIRDWLGASHPAARLAERQISRAEADLALERSKQCLKAGQYREAVEAIDAARVYYPTPRLALASLGMRAIPSVLRQLYLARSA